MNSQETRLNGGRSGFLLKSSSQCNPNVRLVIGISGASGAIYGVRTLEVLKALKFETHLVMTESAHRTIRLETDFKVPEVEGLATHTYKVDDLTSKVSSGSFRTDGMVVVPCSMKTLGGIASGYSDNLLLRAADVTLKERRPLILVARETPLSLIHIENMARVTRAGAQVLPAMPSFYNRPKTVEDIVDQLVGKIMDTLGINHASYRRWESPRQSSLGAEASEGD